jgi:hypothetical protein
MWFALVAPALVVMGLGFIQLADGSGRWAAEPYSEYIAANVRLTPLAYIKAEQALMSTPEADAEAHLLAIEAGLARGEAARLLLPKARAALARDPADARGWVIYARLCEPKDLKAATAALNFSFRLAPREYYLIAPRLYAAAAIWRRLSGANQQLLFAEVRAAGSARKLHGALIAAMSEPGGDAMVTAAYRGRPRALRRLNRLLSAKILGFSS